VIHEPPLHDSRFWVLAQKGRSRPLPFGWSNVRWVAILVARAVRRCGLEGVRVVDRWSHMAGPRTVWPLEGDEQGATMGGEDTGP